MKYLRLLIFLLIVSCNSSKQITGVFVNLEEKNTSKTSQFKIAIEGTSQVAIPNKKGDFKLKKTSEGSMVKLTQDNYLIIKKPVPVNTDKVIFIIDEFREIVKFIKKGANYEKEYNITMEEFKKLPYNIDQDPIYPGCENRKKEAYQKCFHRKMFSHINRYFNADLANELGLNNGHYSILVSFKVDKEGNITNILANAPHPILKKEGIRVIKKLPKVKPGINRNKPVSVKYAMPINFVVE